MNLPSEIKINEKAGVTIINSDPIDSAILKAASKNEDLILVGNYTKEDLKVIFKENL